MVQNKLLDTRARSQWWKLSEGEIVTSIQEYYIFIDTWALFTTLDPLLLYKLHKQSPKKPIDEETRLCRL